MSETGLKQTEIVHKTGSRPSLARVLQVKQFEWLSRNDAHKLKSFFVSLQINHNNYSYVARALFIINVVF